MFALILCINTDKILELLEKNKETDMWANVVAIVIATGIMLILAVMVVSFTVLLIIGLHKVRVVGLWQNYYGSNLKLIAYELARR